MCSVPNSTLNGVDFVFDVPPGTEFPFAPDEFWLFARFYSKSDRTGVLPPLSVTCVWLDSPNGQSTEVWTHDLPPVTFNKTHGLLIVVGCSGIEIWRASFCSLVLEDTNFAFGTR